MPLTNKSPLVTASSPFFPPLGNKRELASWGAVLDGGHDSLVDLLDAPVAVDHDNAV
jgi:hypothetical protein